MSGTCRLRCHRLFHHPAAITPPVVLKFAPNKLGFRVKRAIPGRRTIAGRQLILHIISLLIILWLIILWLIFLLLYNVVSGCWEEGRGLSSRLRLDRHYWIWILVNRPCLVWLWNSSSSSSSSSSSRSSSQVEEPEDDFDIGSNGSSAIDPPPPLPLLPDAPPGVEVGAVVGFSPFSCPPKREDMVSLKEEDWPWFLDPFEARGTAAGTAAAGAVAVEVAAAGAAGGAGIGAAD